MLGDSKAGRQKFLSDLAQQKLGISELVTRDARSEAKISVPQKDSRKHLRVFGTSGSAAQEPVC